MTYEPMKFTEAEMAEREALFLEVLRLEQEFQRLERGDDDKQIVRTDSEKGGSTTGRRPSSPPPRRRAS